MKKFMILLAFLMTIFNSYAQNKPISQKKTLESLSKEKYQFDPNEGKVIPEKELDYTILNYSLATKILKYFESKLSDEDYRKALAYLNKAIDNGCTGAMVYAERGCCEYYLDLYSKAIVDFTKALEINSSIEDDIFQEQEHYDITDSGYVYRSGKNEWIIWLRPSIAYGTRGASKMALKDYRGALSDFNETALYKSQEDNLQLFLSRGTCKFHLKNYNGAKVDFNKVITIDASNAKAYYYRGFCNFNLTLKDSACRDWSKAGELGYEQAYKEIQEYCN